MSPRHTCGWTADPCSVPMEKAFSVSTSPVRVPRCSRRLRNWSLEYRRIAKLRMSENAKSRTDRSEFRQLFLHLLIFWRCTQPALILPPAFFIHLRHILQVLPDWKMLRAGFFTLPAFNALAGFSFSASYYIII